MVMPHTSISIESEDWDELVARLESDALLTQAARDAMTRAAEMLRDEIDSRAVSKIRGTTEILLDQSQGIPDSALVRVKSPLGHIMEHGTGIFGSRAEPYGRTTRSLRLRTALRQTESATSRAPAMIMQVRGRTIFRQMVRGMPPRPFFRPAIDAAQRKIQDIFNEVHREMERRWRRS